MGWFEKEKTVALTCHKCQTRFTIRNRKSLRNGAKSTCRRCGTKFGICVLSPPPPSEVHDQQESQASQLSISGYGSSSKPQAQHLFFRGNGGSLFGIHIVNVFLTLITLGLYTFWAKVKVRKYLWSQVEFSEDRFAYHGTGLELLKGLLRASVIFGIPYLAIAIGPELAGANPWIIFTGKFLAACLALIFVPIAISAARRYRLSRTSWRGIRFSFRGQNWRLVKIYWVGALLNLVTLGAYFPFFAAKQQAFLATNTFFGTQRFRFSGRGKGLLKFFLFPYILQTVILALFFSVFYLLMMGKESIVSSTQELGLYVGTIFVGITLVYLLFYITWFWYLVQQQRYFWEHTYFGEARFHFPITGWAYFRLKLGNFFLLVLTLGFAWPWTVVRNVQFTANYLSLRGPTNLDAIVQDAKQATPTGEGLDSFLDTGFEFG